MQHHRNIIHHTRRIALIGGAALGLCAHVPDPAPAAPYGTRHPYVGYTEFNCARSDFYEHIHIGSPASNREFTLAGGELRVGVKALKDRVADAGECANGTELRHAVIVHYGLDANSELDMVLQVVCLKYDAAETKYYYEASRDMYVINGDGSLTLETNGLDRWRATHGGWANYAAQVVVRRDNGSTWHTVNPAVEVNSTVFPWETTLYHLIEDNELTDADFLRLEPIASPLTREKVGGVYVETGWHQSVCWLPYGRTIDNTTYADKPFKLKAADLGSPCPFICPSVMFTFRESGLDPRDGCKP
jgi:hypothetical protein